MGNVRFLWLGAGDALKGWERCRHRGEGKENLRLRGYTLNIALDIPSKTTDGGDKSLAPSTLA